MFGFGIVSYYYMLCDADVFLLMFVLLLCYISISLHHYIIISLLLFTYTGGSLYPTVGRLKLLDVSVILFLCYIVSVLSLVMITWFYQSRARFQHCIDNFLWRTWWICSLLCGLLIHHDPVLCRFVSCLSTDDTSPTPAAAYILLWDGGSWWMWLSFCFFATLLLFYRWWWQFELSNCSVVYGL